MEEKKGLFSGFLDKLRKGRDGEPDEAVAPPAAEVREEPPAAPEKPSLFQRLKSGLSRTSESFSDKIESLFLGKKKIDEETLEDLEELLVTSDIGVSAAAALIRSLEQRLRRNELEDRAALMTGLKEEMLAILAPSEKRMATEAASPFVILVVGVNGVGKTTTIGKMAARFAREGKKVVIAAGDTFRAAAAEQLEIWGERSGADVIRHREGADPSAVAFDACKAAKARGADILIVDTAGRLHTKVNLMEELKKICRIISREIPGAPHETLLVVDGSTGQNALSQAKLFQSAAGVTGIAMTKLDGSAKGGVVIAVARETSLPIRYIGIGEGVDDLRDFVASDYIDAILE